MKDVLIDENFELVFRNGDFATGESTAQNQHLILMTDKGEWKAHPTVGVGLSGFLNDEGPTRLFREIRDQFAKDGMGVFEIKLDNGKIKIEVK